MNNENSFNPHNMFFCKKKILNDYYSVIFPWLEKCEELFKFENKGIYGLQRIYGFLAERFYLTGLKKIQTILKYRLLEKICQIIRIYKLNKSFKRGKFFIFFRDRKIFFGQFIFKSLSFRFMPLS